MSVVKRYVGFERMTFYKQAVILTTMPISVDPVNALIIANFIIKGLKLSEQKTEKLMTVNIIKYPKYAENSLGIQAPIILSSLAHSESISNKF